MNIPSVDETIAFWFGEIQGGWSPLGQEKLWFGFNADDDRRIVTQFGDAVQHALDGKLEQWLQEPLSRLSYIILLDQMTRSVFRGSAKAFAGDSKALIACKEGLAQNLDKTLQPVQRIFFYMPLEHSENAADQDQCLHVFQTLQTECPSEMMRRAVESVEEHRNIILQFGRFPHRNAVLNRQSTDAELKFLQTHGGFGQS